MYLNYSAFLLFGGLSIVTACGSGTRTSVAPDAPSAAIDAAPAAVDASHAIVDGAHASSDASTNMTLLTSVPTALPNFGLIDSNDSATSVPESVTITNTGGTEAKSIVATITGQHAALFTISTNTCPSTLNVNQTCSLAVVAGPFPVTAFGPVSATLQISYLNSEQIESTMIAINATAKSTPADSFLPSAELQPLPASGHGTSASPGIVTQHASQQIEMHYTNVSQDPAVGFTIDSSHLPAGMTLNTDGFGITLNELASCSIFYDLDTSTVKNFDFPLDTALLASWTDSAGTHAPHALPGISDLYVNVVAAQ